MNKYLEMKRRHQEEVNNFPMMFAFNDSQFKEGMEKLGLTIDDTDKIYSIGGGGYIRKADSKAFSDMFNKHSREKNDAIANDTTGEGFIYEMFRYELDNHEYGYTRDLSDTLYSLGLDMNDINNNENLKNGLSKATKDVIRCYEENN